MNTEKIDKTSNIKYSWIVESITSLMMGWSMATWLIDRLMTLNMDINNICRNTPFGENILKLVSAYIFYVLISNVYKRICSINKDNTLRTALLMVYHVAVFSAMLSIFRVEGLLTIIVLYIVTQIYILHVETDNKDNCTHTTVKTLLYSAVCYGISASQILITLCSEYISNIKVTGLLVFVILSVLSFLALFIKAANEDILYRVE